jgi:hypothetical protein
MVFFVVFEFGTGIILMLIVDRKKVWSAVNILTNVV